MRSIMVTGAGGSAGNNVSWGLRVSRDGPGLEITGTDTDRTSLELNRWIDNAYEIAKSTSPNYVNTINKIAKRRKVELLMPQPDSEVDKLSKSRQELAARVFLPDHSTVLVCQDKYESLVRWHRANLRQKARLLARRSDSIERDIDALEYPCWLRARRGAGGLESILARNREQVRCWMRLHEDKAGAVDFVAEEYLPGRDFCFMSLWNDGRLVTSMVRERLSWVGNRTLGTGGTSKLNRVIHSASVNDAALRSIKAISQKPHGVFCVDLKESVHGQACPTEINCRFTTNVHYLTLASIKLGRPELNFSWIAARLALDEQIPRCRETDAVPEGIWFTKNVDMGFTMVEGDNWRAARFS